MKLPTKALPLRACARLTLSALALTTASTSLADTSETLDTMTVTANRMPTENVLAPTTVITRADIDRLQINDLPTLLSRSPGIDMTMNGGLGKNSSIFMRGNASDHVLVLVDGVKWQSATSGGAALQDFPVEQIERIEIVRGSRSGIYGSEAIGGVIQIFTRQGKSGETKPYFSAGLGTKNTQKATVGVNGGSEATRYNLSYSYLTTNGINAQDTSGGDYLTPDHDGYRNSSLSLNVDHALSEHWSVGANFLRASSYNEYDNGSDDWMTGLSQDPIHHKSAQQIMAVNTKFSVNDLWSMSFELGETWDRLQTIRRSVNYTKFNTRHRAASWINTLSLSDNHTLNIGVDYDHDKIQTTGDYAEKSRDNKAVFTSWQASSGQHEWFLSARHDDNEAFGERTTGTADYGYWLKDDLRLSVNAGTGFKAPTFNDLYWPDAGNPDVRPEKSESYGVGIQGAPSWGTWAVNAYKSRVRDLITWADDGTGTFTYRPFNVDEAKIKGIEFELQTMFAGWDVAFDASFLKPEDEETGENLIRRAQRYANLHLDKQWNKWSAGASWKLRGHTYIDPENTERLGGFGLVDLRFAYAVDPEWTVRLTGQNMLNKDYQTVDEYYSQGRTVMLSVHFQP